MNAVGAARRRTIVRGVVVLLLASIGFVNAMALADGHRDTLAYLAVPLCAAALLVPRLRQPIGPLIVVGLVALAGASHLMPLLCVALYDLAAARRLRLAWASLATVLGVNAIIGLHETFAPYQYTTPLMFSLLAIVGGVWVGGRRRVVSLLAAQVEHLKTEASLREEAARSNERARIAAEMHDVLAHRLSMIALHTGVLVSRGDELPERVTDRLRMLRTASTEALTDLRDVLGALRAPDDEPRVEPVTGQVERLVEEARAAGQSIDLVVDGTPTDAPTTHRLGVYRLTQEALTNARKHADGATVRVRIDYRRPTTRVEVTNAAGARALDVVGSGYGLVGLRERITALGGRLQAGPDDAGDWRLTATIPHPTEDDQEPAP